jgi:hypothetical protein
LRQLTVKCQFSQLLCRSCDPLRLIRKSKIHTFSNSTIRTRFFASIDQIHAGGKHQ